MAELRTPEREQSPLQSLCKPHSSASTASKSIQILTNRPLNYVIYIVLGQSDSVSRGLKEYSQN